MMIKGVRFEMIIVFPVRYVNAVGYARYAVNGDEKTERIKKYVTQMQKGCLIKQEVKIDESENQ